MVPFGIHRDRPGVFSLGDFASGIPIGPAISHSVFCFYMLVIKDNDKPLAVLLKHEHFLAMQEQRLKNEQ